MLLANEAVGQDYKLLSLGYPFTHGGDTPCAVETLQTGYSRHGMALNLPLMTAYLMKYSDPDVTSFRQFILEKNMKADRFFIVGKL